MKKRQLRVIVNGTSYDVELGDTSSSPMIVYVNEKAYEVIIPPEEDGHPVEKTPVIKKVESKPVTIPTKREPASTSNGTNEIRAPMPGTILDISVKSGDKVKKGDQICALEAMKMKSAIRAPRDGEIASVEVSEGQKVIFGDVLIRFA
jgi:biotin carboxyl carrier protein